MGTKVRVLVTVRLGGVEYAPNQVIDLPASVAKALAADGQVDPHKEAVDYCIKELGEKVIVHIPALTPEERAALAEEIAALETTLTAAADADKAAIQAQIDEKKALLA